MKTIFITATGTNIGKTYFTAKLAKKLISEGKKVAAIKPVISGYKFEEISDLHILCDATNLTNSPENHNKISLYKFSEPLSPCMAARKNNIEIEFYEIKNFINNYINSATQTDLDYLLIEGVGGVMAPITERHTNLDLIRAINAPAILVTGSYLGSISHTLTAYGMLKNCEVNIEKIIISESLDKTHELYICPQETKHSLENFISGDIEIINFGI